jgi:tRNA(Ile)-lysidine synthase TilS/MesJ
MNLLRDFQHSLQVTDTLERGTVIVLGGAGGADSLVMLHLFTQSREALGVQPHVLHVDHRIRGPGAQAETYQTLSNLPSTNMIQENQVAGCTVYGTIII